MEVEVTLSLKLESDGQILLTVPAVVLLSSSLVLPAAAVMVALAPMRNCEKLARTGQHGITSIFALVLGAGFFFSSSFEKRSLSYPD